MADKKQPGREMLSRRKVMLWAGVLALAYPALRFIGVKLPRKPTFVPINKPVPASGFLVTADFVLFDRQQQCWALSRKCTHLGCRLNYHEERDILECPCHQSQFNARTGEIIQGPATRVLTFFPVEKRQNDPLYVVTT